MILGQLRIRTHQTENAPLYTGIKVAYWGTHSILDLFLEPCKIDGNMAVKATYGAEDLWLHAINMPLCNGPRSISRLIPVKSSSYHTLDYSSKKMIISIFLLWLFVVLLKRFYLCTYNPASNSCQVWKFELTRKAVGGEWGTETWFGQISSNISSRKLYQFYWGAENTPLHCRRMWTQHLKVINPQFPFHSSLNNIGQLI